MSRLARLLTALLAFAALPALATVPTATSSSGPYSCDGSTTAFTVGYRFLANSDLVVTKKHSSGTETTLVLTTDYTVSGAGSTTGGTVTLVSGNRCGSGYTLTVKRAVPLTQTTAFSSQGAFSPKAHENAFDRLTMAVQQVERARGEDKTAQATKDAAQDAALASETTTRAAADTAETAARAAGDAGAKAYADALLAGIGAPEANAARVTALEALTSGWKNPKSNGTICTGSGDDGPELVAAASAALGEPAGLVIPCKMRITSAVGTISAGVVFLPGGSLDLQAGGSVTFGGPVTADLHQIFYMNGGTATFAYGASVPWVYPEWWGAKRDGTELNPLQKADGSAVTDDRTAIQYAIDSTRPVWFSPGVYFVGSALRFPAMPAATKLAGANRRYEASGRRGTTHIHTNAASLFLPAVDSTYSSITQASAQISGISFQTSNTSTVAFDRLAFTAGTRITNCTFHNFKHVLYGTFNGVSSFDWNIVAASQNSAFKRLANADFDPNLTAPVVDSSITHNYFNASPLVATPNFFILDIAGANSTLIENNYIDFAWGGIYTGSMNGLITIRGNTLDILYRAIELPYGTFSVAIEGNRFFRMRKASASYFTNPTAEMVANDWTCIYMGQHVREVTVVGNVHRDSERFIDMPAKWYKNIKEWGTVGRTLTSPVVRMTGRQVDEAGYNGIGETGDGTGFSFESRDGEARSTFPNKVQESYEGHRFIHTGVTVYTRSSRFVDANGQQTWGRSNLAGATDFSAGWTPAAGFAIAGGIATLDGSTSGWKYSDNLGTPLQPGTYAIIYTIATRTSGSSTYMTCGVKLNDATTVTCPDSTPAGDSPAGQYYGTVVVPAGKTGTNLAFYTNTGFAGTANEYRIYRFTSP